jgi:hypothetical protein
MLANASVAQLRTLALVSVNKPVNLRNHRAGVVSVQAKRANRSGSNLGIRVA